MSRRVSRIRRRSKRLQPILALKLTGLIWAGAGAGVLVVLLLSAILSNPLFSV